MTLKIQRPNKRESAQQDKREFKRTVLIDADLLCYAISDPIHYEVQNGLTQIFQYKKEAVQYCKDNKLDPECILKVKDEPEPVQNALHSVKLMIQQIVQDCQANPRLILSSPTNFRYDIAPNYKANRKDLEKPYHYQNIKDYLIRTWGAEVAPDGLEADDFIAMEYTRMYYDNDHMFYDIIATLDKDFHTVPGCYYKWRGHNAGSTYWVSADDAEAFLCYQLLVGDNADNIISPLKAPLKSGKLGKSGYGHAKARDFLLQCTYSEMRTAIRCLYVSQGFEEEFDLNYKLLGIGRTEV